MPVSPLYFVKIAPPIFTVFPDLVSKWAPLGFSFLHAFTAGEKLRPQKRSLVSGNAEDHSRKNRKNDSKKPYHERLRGYVLELKD
jgi:hypothetical protein